MKNAFKKALTLFKYLFALFSIVFWIYMINDDWIFIEKYGFHWTKDILEWARWYFSYFVLGFTLYYWLITSVLILIYHKLIKRS